MLLHLREEKFLDTVGKEGGKDPSLFLFRLKQFALFVLEREPHPETDRTDTVGAGQQSIG